MKNIYKLTLVFFILLFSISPTSYSQSYEFAPEVFFKTVNDRPVVVISSVNGTGILEYGDSLAVRIYDSDEQIRVYGKNEQVDLDVMHVQMYLPIELLPNLKKGGIHYLRINDKVYVYPNEERKIQIEKANDIFKDY